MGIIIINSLLHPKATQYKFERRHTTKETLLVHQLLLYLKEPPE